MRILHPPRRLMMCALGTLVALPGPGSVRASEADGALQPESLSVAFTAAAFLNMNRTDVEAGYKALVETVGRKRGYLIQSGVHIFAEPAEFEALLRDEAVRLVIVNSWRYVSMDTRQLTPCFVSSDQGKVGKAYMLLTRRGSGLNTLADLRGKDIGVYEVANTTLGRVWLETLLLENQCGKAEDFFSRVDGVGKPTTAVLPVFFGKKQACVVDQASFELMKELNPQVGQAIQVVAASELLVDSMVCLRNSGWPPGNFREDVIETLADFHREPAGAQLLTLFKTDQLMPFDDAQLTTMRRLRATYDRLQQEAGS